NSFRTRDKIAATSSAIQGQHDENPRHARPAPLSSFSRRDVRRLPVVPAGNVVERGDFLPYDPAVFRAGGGTPGNAIPAAIGAIRPSRSLRCAAQPVRLDVSGASRADTVGAAD